MLSYLVDQFDFSRWNPAQLGLLSVPSLITKILVTEEAILVNDSK